MLGERSHSGLVHRSRKPEWGKLHRGFKSHPLRHLNFGFRIADFGFGRLFGALVSKSAIRNPKSEILEGRGARVVELAALEML